MLRGVNNSKGALLNKQASFSSRDWRLSSVKTIDLLCGLNNSISIYFKDYEIIKVLPYRNSKGRWISDKVRFFYDGLKYQRVLKPISKVKRKDKELDWSKLTVELGSYLEVYSHVYGVSSIGFFCDSLLDLKTLHRTKELTRFVGCNNPSFNEVGYNKIDLVENYKFNYLFNKLDNLDFCLFVGINPRYESSTVNIKLRKVFKKGLSNTVSFGFFPSSTFVINFCGLTFKNFIKFCEGKNELSKYFKKAKSPIIIYGCNIRYRRDFVSFENMLLKLFKDSLVSKNSCVNFLSCKSNYVGVLNLGFKKQSFKKLLELKLVYTLGFLDIKNTFVCKSFKNPLIIGQHYHPLNNYSYLIPTKTFLETSGLYQNIEGYIQESRQVLSSKQLDNNEIMLNLVHYLKYHSEVFKDIKSVSCNKYKYLNLSKKDKDLIINNLKEISFNNWNEIINNENSIKKSNIKIINKRGFNINKLYLTYIKYSVEDFYLNESFCRFSKILTEMSRTNRKYCNNYDFLDVLSK